MPPATRESCSVVSAGGIPLKSYDKGIDGPPGAGAARLNRALMEGGRGGARSSGGSAYLVTGAHCRGLR